MSSTSSCPNGLAAFLLAGVVVLAAPASLVTAGPDAWRIDRLTHEIQGNSPEQVRAVIVARFGPPARNVGSGLQIDQWDVDGGVLTFHPLVGPSVDKDGVSTRLIRTTNPAALCLFGSYEMFTLAEGPHGMNYWLGNVSVLADSRYEYRDSRASLEYRTRQSDNFFMRHRRSRKVYRIVSDRSAMRLAFEGDGMSFQMDRAWENYWR